MRPIAIVIPWFGAELTGGAERQAFELAVRLISRRHQVEVLTTCCRSFEDDWATNYYPPGESSERGLTVRRFRVDARNDKSFAELNHQLLASDPTALRPGVSPLSPAQSQVFVDENINSRELLDYLRERADDYHVFIFLRISTVSQVASPP
ncbi:MAG: hypothetical protein WKF30_01345 [Pyrinomonadaceae bacterium]